MERGISPVLARLVLKGDKMFTDVKGTAKLNDGAKKFLDGYKSLLKRRSVVDLNQNPKKRPRGTLVSGALPCLTTNSAHLYSMELKRSLTGQEMLESVGIPISKSAAAAANLKATCTLKPCFNVIEV